MIELLMIFAGAMLGVYFTLLHQEWNKVEPKPCEACRLRAQEDDDEDDDCWSCGCFDCNGECEDDFEDEDDDDDFEDDDEWGWD